MIPKLNNFRTDSIKSEQCPCPYQTSVEPVRNIRKLKNVLNSCRNLPMMNGKYES